MKRTRIFASRHRVSPARSHSVRTMCRLKRASESFLVSRVFSVCLCRAARRRVSHADLTRRDGGVSDWENRHTMRSQTHSRISGSSSPTSRRIRRTSAGGLRSSFSARSHRSSRVKPSAGPNFCSSGTREAASVAAFERAREAIFYGLRPGSADGVPKNHRDTRISGRPTDGRVGRKYRGV